MESPVGGISNWPSPCRLDWYFTTNRLFLFKKQKDPEPIVWFGDQAGKS